MNSMKDNDVLKYYKLRVIARNDLSDALGSQSDASGDSQIEVEGRELGITRNVSKALLKAGESVCQVKIDDMFCGVGFHIGKGWLVTNQHVICYTNDENSDVDRASFCFPNAEFEPKPRTVVFSYFQDPETTAPLDERGKDLALVYIEELEDEPGLGNEDLHVDTADIGDRVFLVHFSDDGKQQFSIDDNVICAPASAENKATGQKIVFHTAHARAGCSGAPLMHYKEDQLVIVGVHFAGPKLGDNMADIVDSPGYAVCFADSQWISSAVGLWEEIDILNKLSGDGADGRQSLVGVNKSLVDKRLRVVTTHTRPTWIGPHDCSEIKWKTQEADTVYDRSLHHEMTMQRGNEWISKSLAEVGNAVCTIYRSEKPVGTGFHYINGWVMTVLRRIKDSGQESLDTKELSFKFPEITYKCDERSIVLCTCCPPNKHSILPCNGTDIALIYVGDLLSDKKVPFLFHFQAELPNVNENVFIVHLNDIDSIPCNEGSSEGLRCSETVLAHKGKVISKCSVTSTDRPVRRDHRVVVHSAHSNTKCSGILLVEGDPNMKMTTHWEHGISGCIGEIDILNGHTVAPRVIHSSRECSGALIIESEGHLTVHSSHTIEGCLSAFSTEPDNRTIKHSAHCRPECSGAPLFYFDGSDLVLGGIHCQELRMPQHTEGVDDCPGFALHTPLKRWMSCASFVKHMVDNMNHYHSVSPVDSDVNGICERLETYLSERQMEIFVPSRTPPSIEDAKYGQIKWMNR